jgi:hypothetical protein
MRQAPKKPASSASSGPKASQQKSAASKPAAKSQPAPKSSEKPKPAAGPKKVTAAAAPKAAEPAKKAVAVKKTIEKPKVCPTLSLWQNLPSTRAEPAPWDTMHTGAFLLCVCVPTTVNTPAGQACDDGHTMRVCVSTTAHMRRTALVASFAAALIKAKKKTPSSASEGFQIKHGEQTYIHVHVYMHAVWNQRVWLVKKTQKGFFG